jgi:hypothetical protein
MSRQHLADKAGLTRQAFVKLQRSPGSSMRPENVARVARHLRCDLYWLCTGEGGEYIAEHIAHEHSLLARDIAGWIDAMPDEDRNRAFALIYQMTCGRWPSFPASLLHHGNSQHDGSPTSSRPSVATHQTPP